MSQLIDLINQSDVRLKAANARSDRTATLKIFEDFRTSVTELNNSSEDIKKQLSNWVQGARNVRIDLLLTAAAIHADLHFIDELCALLAMKDPKVPDEMIIDVMYKVPSSKAVSYVAEALFRNYEYDAYNEFNIKCLEVLAAINTPDAWVAIERARVSSSDRVRSRAIELSDNRRGSI